MKFLQCLVYHTFNENILSVVMIRNDQILFGFCGLCRPQLFALYLSKMIISGATVQFLGIVFIICFKGRCRTRLPFGFDLGSVGWVVVPCRCCPFLRNEVGVHRSCPCGPWVRSYFRVGNQSPVLAWNLWEEIRQNL